MPSLVREMLAWLRFYLILPIPPIAGESEAEAASRAEPTSPAAIQAIPLAGAVVGALVGRSGSPLCAASRVRYACWRSDF
jgi:hypothetical protein